MRTRAAWIGRIQPLLRREGFRIRSGAPETFITRVAELTLPAVLLTVIAPLLRLLEPINAQIQALDEELERIVATDDVARRLTTVPGVGPVTAVAFVATVDDVSRFRGAHQLEAYLGLVPSEWSSSEVQRRGQITKAGNNRMRWLLVQAAWCILRRRRKSETAALRDWPTGSLAVADDRSPQWPWPDDWQESCSRSGAIGPPTTRASFGN